MIFHIRYLRLGFWVSAFWSSWKKTIQRVKTVQAAKRVQILVKWPYTSDHGLWPSGPEAPVRLKTAHFRVTVHFQLFEISFFDLSHPFWSWPYTLATTENWNSLKRKILTPCCHKTDCFSIIMSSFKFNRFSHFCHAASFCFLKHIYLAKVNQGKKIKKVTSQNRKVKLVEL